MPDSCLHLQGYSLGIFFIVIVAVIWAGASVLTQWIYNSLDFESPFLVTYISTALFSLYLPLWRLWVYLGYVQDPSFRRVRSSEGSGFPQQQKRERRSEPQQPLSPCQEEDGTTGPSQGYQTNTSSTSTSEDPPLVSSTTAQTLADSSNQLLESTADALCSLLVSAPREGGSYEPLPCDETDPCPPASQRRAATEGSEGGAGCSHEEVLVIAMKVAPLWFIANCSYNYSLLLTSVGSSTIISNLSGSFTLLFAASLGLERITGGKLLALFLSLAGVALIALQDESDDSPQTLSGDLVALGGAAFYGLYTTTIRLQVPEGSTEGEGEGDSGTVSMQLLFGYIGAVTAVFLSPCLFFLGVFGLGRLSELTGEVLGFVLLGSIFNNVISDYLWARSVVLTSPTIATVGLSITIPLAILSDFMFFGTLPTFLSGSGAVLVVCGFVVISAEHRLRIGLAKACPGLVCWAVVEEGDGDAGSVHPTE